MWRPPSDMPSRRAPGCVRARCSTVAEPAPPAAPACSADTPVADRRAPPGAPLGMLRAVCPPEPEPPGPPEPEPPGAPLRRKPPAPPAPWPPPKPAAAAGPADGTEPVCAVAIVSAANATGPLRQATAPRTSATVDSRRRAEPANGAANSVRTAAAPATTMTTRSHGSHDGVRVEQRVCPGGSSADRRPPRAHAQPASCDAATTGAPPIATSAAMAGASATV